MVGVDQCASVALKVNSFTVRSR